MHPAADVPDGGGRLAVKIIEGALGTEPNELGIRLAEQTGWFWEPDWVVLMPRSVGEDVAESVHTILWLTLGCLEAMTSASWPARTRPRPRSRV
jgi:hypothetical protein